MQWQAAEDTVFTIATLGNHGVHLTPADPLQPAQIATPQHPITVKIYSYGYTPFDQQRSDLPNCNNGPPNPASAALTGR